MTVRRRKLLQRAAWPPGAAACRLTIQGLRSTATFHPLRPLNPQKVVMVGASLHIGGAAGGHLALGATWGYHTTSRERKKPGVI